MNRSLMMSMCLVVGFILSEQVVADELRPVLGTKGKLLFEEAFGATELSPKWTHSVGKLRLDQGALAAAEQASDKHACAFRHAVAVQDCAVQFDFKLAVGTKFLHFGYDPAAGEIKKKGHLFSVAVTPSGWSLIEHGDKNDAKPQNKVHATQKTTFDSDKWYTVLVECNGDNVVAQIAGKEPLRVTSTDFHAKKPGLVFRVGGPDDKSVRFDNIKVWELK
jgi:hypothetical protein